MKKVLLGLLVVLSVLICFVGCKEVELPLNVLDYMLDCKSAAWFNKLVGSTGIKRDQILSISFLDKLPDEVDVYEGFEDGVDLSLYKTGDKVKGYVVESDTDNKYDVYIVGDSIYGSFDCYEMFNSFENVESIDFSNFDASYVLSMRFMFSGYDDDAPELSKLKTIKFGNKFNTSNVTDMSFMFLCCSGLEELDLSDFDTSSVTNMEKMFLGCSTLQSLDLSSFDTTNVTVMYMMFDDALNSLKIDPTEVNKNHFGADNVLPSGFAFNGIDSYTKQPG